MTSEITQAVVLGIVQGLTEFLPVSSSGHLELAKFLMADQSLADQSLLMTVTLHFATALSTLIVFRNEVFEIGRGLLQFKWNDEFLFCAKIVLSMFPAAAVGILLDDQIEQLFNQRIALVGFMLIVTGILLFLADRAKHTERSVGFLDAMVIGMAQMVAILPGLSRSGATIGTSVLLGIDREKAARFSFLMVVPLIFGKMAKDVLGGASGEWSVSWTSTMPLAIGFVAAFLTGLLACRWMIQLVKFSKLYYFSIYCFVVAAWAIVTVIVR